MGGGNILTHKDLNKLTTCKNPSGSLSVALIGHAYNPFTMEADEEKILAHISEAWGTDAFQDRIDELTGVFTLLWTADGTLHFETDPAGMQPAFYGTPGGGFVLSSHAQLIADVYNPEPSPLAREIMAYRWYRPLTGAYLPGDLSPFEGIKRAVPDIVYHVDAAGQVSHRRFWPLKEGHEATGEEYDAVISRAAAIMRGNMALIAKKWSHPAISLTGGVDSNTTFAAANGHYEEYQTFSYLSAPKEAPDAEAARKIAAAFHVPHTLYEIPAESSAFTDFALKAEILAHNGAYTHPLKENELRKRLFLEEHCAIPVEVKSWVSETVRGACYHRYRRTSMPKLSPRLFRNLYKVFLENRVLAHKVDKLFAHYIDDYEMRRIPSLYPPADMYFHEVGWGSWGGVSIEEMKYCFDITIPYNNRKLLDLLFHVPLKRRLEDRHHSDMKALLNQRLSDMNIHVANVEETDRRARILNAIFTINMHLPF